MKAKKWAAFCLLALISTGVSAQFGCAQQGRGETPNSVDQKSEVVAEINGRAITRKEVDTLVGTQVYGLEEKIYSLRKSALDSLITKALLEEEARVKGITVEELKNQLTPEKVEITQDEIDQLYIQNAVRLSTMTEVEAKQKIKADLESRLKSEKFQGSVVELRNKVKVNITLKEPIPPVITVNADGPSKGPQSAPITIVEFSDFECSFCKQATSTMKQVLQSYGGQVKLVYKHLPLANHPQAFKAAQASFCAGEQGRFWEYHDLLFDHANILKTEDFGKYSTQLGLKTDQFKACLNSESSRAAVNKDIQEAKKAGVSVTPTFFINGRLVLGSKSLEDFKTIINQELKGGQKTEGSNSGA